MRWEDSWAGHQRRSEIGAVKELWLEVIIKLQIYTLHKLYINELSSTNSIKRIDCGGGCVLPGFVDAHSHPIFAGDRVHEFAMKLAGASYLEANSFLYIISIQLKVFQIQDPSIRRWNQFLCSMHSQGIGRGIAWGFPAYMYRNACLWHHTIGSQERLWTGY